MNLESMISGYHLAAVTPEIVLSLGALVVLLAGSFCRPEVGQRVLPLLGLAFTLATAIATLALWNLDLIFGLTHQAAFVADNFALFFKLIFLVGLGFSMLLAQRFLHARSGDRQSVGGEYYGLLMLCTVGMMMVASANDLLVVFLGIETLSVALYVLAGFARTWPQSNEAAVKYFLLGAFATGFLLYGIALVYAGTGTTVLSALPAIVANGDPSGHLLLFTGAALLLVGLGFKAALVPFHQWTPDVYEGSPTPVTAFMSVGAKAAAFAGVLRIFAVAFGGPEVATYWFPLLLVMCVLTMTVANLMALAQNSMKRLLAYSSIAHAGYAVVGVLTAGKSGAGASDGLFASAIGGVMYYLLVYAVMNLGAFAVLVFLENQRSETASEDANIWISELRGLAWRRPWLAAALTLFLLSLAGIPPTPGFFAKLLIFRDAMGPLPGLVIVAFLNTVVGVYYYLRPLVAMYMSDESAPAPAGPGNRSFSVVLAIVMCAAGLAALVIFQNQLFTWAIQASPL